MGVIKFRQDQNDEAPVAGGIVELGQGLSMSITDDGIPRLDVGGGQFELRFGPYVIKYNDELDTLDVLYLETD